MLLFFPGHNIPTLNDGSNNTLPIAQIYDGWLLFFRTVRFNSVLTQSVRTQLNTIFE